MSDAQTTIPPPPPPTTAPPPPTPPGTGAPGATGNNDNVLAAVAYILLFITGLIVLLTSKPYEKYKRWHALQAIGLGVFVLLLQFAINVFAVIFSFGAVWPLYMMLGNIVAVLTLILIIILAIKAYQGEKIRIPVIADIADKNA